MKKTLGCLAVPALLISSTGPVLAGSARDALVVKFANCTEFVGIAPVDEAKARDLVPAGYQLVTDGTGAKLVVRVADCDGVTVGRNKAWPGRVAQIGLMVVSPDGTGTDPNTAINNYTLTYASNSPALVNGLRRYGVPASLDTRLAYDAAPAAGPGELYAAIAPSTPGAVTWFLHGTVNTPQVPTKFLANWWYQSDARGEAKMATDIQAIAFDFTSQVSFYTSRQNPIGALIGASQIASFPLSFRGQFAEGVMTVSLPR